MSITIQPDLEARLRARAEAEGITVEMYLERIASEDERAEDELEGLALQGGCGLREILRLLRPLDLCAELSAGTGQAGPEYTAGAGDRRDRVAERDRLARHP